MLSKTQYHFCFTVALAVSAVAFSNPAAARSALINHMSSNSTFISVGPHQQADAPARVHWNKVPDSASPGGQEGRTSKSQAAICCDTSIPGARQVPGSAEDAEPDDAALRQDTTGE